MRLTTGMPTTIAMDTTIRPHLTPWWKPTALLHEAFIRLFGGRTAEFSDRAHFLGIAARIMRQVLVDYARSHRASKRGGDICRLALEEAGEQSQALDVDIVALDDALKSLAEMDSQQSRVVELKFFGGLSIEEAAEVLGVSASTVKRDWTTARAWLYRELDRSAAT